MTNIMDLKGRRMRDGRLSEHVWFDELSILASALDWLVFELTYPNTYTDTEEPKCIDPRDDD